MNFVPLPNIYSALFLKFIMPANHFAIFNMLIFHSAQLGVH